MEGVGMKLDDRPADSHAVALFHEETLVAAVASGSFEFDYEILRTASSPLRSWLPPRVGADTKSRRAGVEVGLGGEPRKL